METPYPFIRDSLSPRPGPPEETGAPTGADVKLDTLSDYKTMIELAAKQGYVHEDELQTLQQWRRDPANWKKSAQ